MASAPSAETAGQNPSQKTCLAVPDLAVPDVEPPLVTPAKGQAKNVLHGAACSLREFLDEPRGGASVYVAGLPGAFGFTENAVGEPKSARVVRECEPEHPRGEQFVLFLKVRELLYDLVAPENVGLRPSFEAVFSKLVERLHVFMYTS